MNLLIVDDDKIICAGLKKIIQNMDLGFEEYLEAHDGNVAFEICKAHDITILITDIRMHNMNGIDLISKVRTINNQTQFIVLSGYADFNYAKSAIQNNVVSYLLKPVQKAELSESLKTAISNYQNVCNHRDTKSKILELFLEDYTMNYNPSSNYQNKLKELNFSLQFDSLACIYFFKTGNLSLPNNLCCILSQFFVNNFSQHLIINFNRANFPQILNDIALQIHNIPHSHVSVSAIGNQISELPLLLQESQLTALMRYLNPKQSVFLFENSMVTTSDEPDWADEFLELKNAFTNGNTNSIMDILDVFLTKIELSKNISIPYLLKFFSNIYYAGAKNLFYSEEDYQKFYISCNSLIDFFEGLKNKIYLEKPESTLSIAKIHKLAKNAKLKLAFKYIDSNFNSLQTIDELAIKLDVTSNHLRKLFKQELRISFSQYLLMYRMEKAKDYLKNPQYKIYEISYLIGIDDEKYFYKLFKKQFGITPTQYRNELYPEQYHIEK